MLDYNIIVICVTVLLVNMSYGLTAPILPPLLEARGVASSYIGSIWTCFSVAVIIVSLIAGSIVNCVGHSLLMTIGAMVMAAAIAAYSTAVYIPDDGGYEFLYLAIALNTIQGKQSTDPLRMVFQWPGQSQAQIFTPLR